MGSQTAVVTGPSGEEIWTDKYGRVKIQFHWDRYGEHDENSSCWVRVSHPTAGKNWGAVQIPRIGQEVIVDFLEGDPDQPIITGRVYNAEQMPPFALPASDMVAGMKSNSTPGGGGYNEISMDDTKGKEGITIHGQYDMNTTVENDQNTTIVSGNRSVTVKSGTFTEKIKGDTKITIDEGTYSHKVAANKATYHVSGALTENYDDTQTTSVKSTITITSVEAQVHVNAGKEIKLKTGDSQLLMKKDGTIQLTGKNIVVTGDTDIKISAPQVSGTGTKEVTIGVGVNSVTTDTKGVSTGGAKITSAAVGVHEISGALIKLN
jgi:type VI secretion system secreted protein VgrG